MTAGPISVLQINTLDEAGGAEKVARNLHTLCNLLGLRSYMAVGTKRSSDHDVFQIPRRSRAARLALGISDMLVRKGGFLKLAGKFIMRVTDLPHELSARTGREDFHFPGTRHILDLPPHRPDILHIHNLHGMYFDLRELPNLCRKVPVVMTLHDAWLLSGHCAHSFQCDKWKQGCGNCPDLSIPPRVRRDATGYNWNRKKKILSESRFYCATPCAWLMKKVDGSMIKPGIIESRVIPNGVDLTIFRSGPKAEARSRLGLPDDAVILLFAANGIRKNIWKDYTCMKSALSLLSLSFRDRKLIFLALGEDSPDENLNGAVIRFIPYQHDQHVVASYYQAADLYLHAARAETFPNTIIEALACGTPVAATRVGGIPEQVADLSAHDPGTATGMLSPESDAPALARNVETILRNNSLMSQMGANAARQAAMRFDVIRQAESYIRWYEEILGNGTLPGDLTDRLKRERKHP